MVSLAERDVLNARVLRRSRVRLVEGRYGVLVRHVLGEGVLLAAVVGEGGCPGPGADVVATGRIGIEVDAIGERRILLR